MAEHPEDGGFASPLLPVLLPIDLVLPVRDYGCIPTHDRGAVSRELCRGLQEGSDDEHTAQAEGSGTLPLGMML